MTDTVQGAGVEGIVNTILADTTWGHAIDGQWAMRASEPSVLRPSHDTETDQDWLSYSEWLTVAHPGASNKEIRFRFQSTFTLNGQPGEALAEHANRLAAGLRNPDGTPVRIIPAFFHLLLALKRDKRPFTLCFRTFGEDLENIITELNAFCEGTHPLCPPGIVFDGSDGQPDYRVTPGDAQKCGTFYRDENTTAVIWGTWWQPEHERVPGIHCYNEMQGISIMQGALRDIGARLRETFETPGTLALRDYFLYWKARDMTSLGGKLFFYQNRVEMLFIAGTILHSYPTIHFICANLYPTESRTHELFFDDNIRFLDAHIVQPVEMTDPAKRQWPTPLLQAHLCRAEPLESIFDQQYFVKKVAMLEQNYDRKLIARKRLIKYFRLAQSLTRIKFPDVEHKNNYDPWSGLRQCEHDHRLPSILSACPS